MSEDIIKKEYLLQQYDEKSRLYESFVNEVKHQVSSILAANHIKCNAIASRLKDRGSLAEKIERKRGKYTQLSDITDVAGIRIITYYSDDVDKIAKIIESEFDVDQENSIDKRESLEPDRFGYCSVHYVVKMSTNRLALSEYRAFNNLKCEIQIRSVLQHAWAEIEHDIGYKSEITIPKEMRRSFSRIAGLLEIADKEFNEIRQALTEYRNNAQTQIANDSFLDRELDAVIIEVMLTSNTYIQAINQHISGIIGKPLTSVNNDDFQSDIYRLNWLGIKTVRQLSEALSAYSELAKSIASEKLKGHRKGEPGEFRTTIALFYLCYAIVLINNGTKDYIRKYLIETHIGLPEELDKNTQDIYGLKHLIDSCAYGKN